MKGVRGAAVLTVFFLTVLLSGCVQEGLIKQEFSTQVEKNTEDFSYKVEVYPTHVKPGETVKIRFIFEPKKDINDMMVRFFDTCIFSPDYYGKKISLKKGTPKTLTVSFIAGETSLPKTCRLGFEFSYEANYTKAQDIIVLSYDEYERRSKENSLGEFVPETHEEESPLKISLSFSEEQPFEQGDEISMTIQYSNVGKGTLEIKDVKIRVPENLHAVSCDDYTIESDRSGRQVLSLSKKLKFYGSSTENSVCRFQIWGSQPVDIKLMEIEGKYIYELEDYITVGVDVK